MGDIKLFQLKKQSVSELLGTAVAVEKSLQQLIEKNMETFLGVTFLASEYSTGKTHGGRIDSLGIDENGCPVIVEYKRSTNENVINQGLFYLDWLLDHKAEFKLLVLDEHGKAKADAIEWSSPRLLCIAGDFTKYDAHAVQQINRNIELIRYRRFGRDLLCLELVNAVSAQEASNGELRVKKKPRSADRTITETLRSLPTELLDRYEALRSFIAALGDDVQEKTLKYYVAFKRIKNLACVEIHPTRNTIVVFAKLNPGSVKLEKGFTRDVSKIGHYGTGDLEITLKSSSDFERAKDLIVRAYEGN